MSKKIILILIVFSLILSVTITAFVMYPRHQMEEFKQAWQECQTAECYAEYCHQSCLRSSSEISLYCEKEICYIGAAEKFLDGSICEKYIKDQDNKNDCYSNLAYETKNDDFCDKIEEIKDDAAHSLESKLDCYLSYGPKKITPALCQRLEYVEKEYGVKISPACYSSMAANKQDPQYCEKLKYKDSRQACFEKSGLLSHEIDYCPNFQDTKARDDCLYLFAQNRNDLSLCNQIENKYDKDDCCLSLLPTINDLAGCDSIITDSQICKDTCYKQIAIKTQNQEICDKAVKRSIRSQCFTTIYEQLDMLK